LNPAIGETNLIEDGTYQLSRQPELGRTQRPSFIFLRHIEISVALGLAERFLGLRPKFGRALRISGFLLFIRHVGNFKGFFCGLE
jgi:hypothetical protein